MFRLISLVLIGTFVIFYIDSYFDKKIVEAKQRVDKIDKKIAFVKSKEKELKKEIFNLDLDIKKLKKEIAFYQEELRFLKPYLQESLFYIDDERFFEILEKIVSGAKRFDKVSYFYSKNSNYKIFIKGSFKKSQFFDFVKFLASIEKIKRVKKFNKVILVDKGDVEFEIEITFFGIKFIE